MSLAKNHETAGYIDDLRKAIDLPEMRFLFVPGMDGGWTFWKNIAARHGDLVAHLPAVAVSPDAIPNETRWEMSEQLAITLPDWRIKAKSVVSALGYCRLFAIDLPEEIGTKLRSPLPAELLVPAIEETLLMLATATDDARSLPMRFDNAVPPNDQPLCISLLQSLMELWAIFIVVDDEYQLHLNAQQNLAFPFHAWMRRLLDAFAALDDVTQQEEQVFLLSVATELPLLENWRTTLAEPYRDPLPWWLDGTLEEAAAQVEYEVLNVDPFGQRKVAATAPQTSSQAASPRYTASPHPPTKPYTLAATPSGLLGDITSVVMSAATSTGQDPLGVLRDLGIDEPRLQTNPVWCLDQLAAAIPLPEIRSQLYGVFLKHNIDLPPVVVEEIMRNRKLPE